MKRIISILLAVMLLAASALSAGAAETEPEAAEQTAEVQITAGEEKEIAETGEGADAQDKTEEAEVVEKADPVVTQVSTISGGLKVVWSAYEGAEKYRLFIKNTSGSGKAWIKVADTADTVYAHRGLTANTEYIYTVRAIAGNQYISGFDTVGYAFTYYSAPVLKAECVYGGVKVSWSGVSGAPMYRVYRKSGSAWVHRAFTAAASYTDTDVASGKSYTYTVRVCSQDQKTMLSFYDKNGVSVKYFEAPVITGFAPISGGTRVSWAASVGAAKYRLFVKNTGGSGKAWTKIGDTDSLSLDHKNLTGGVTYTYTVRAMDQKGNYVSGFDPVGKERMYLDPPAISSVKKVKSGTLVTWNAVGGVKKYRVYRKTFGGAWDVIGDSGSASYIDTTAAQGVLYGYTVRCVGEDNKVASHYINETKYYLNGEPANGKITVNGSTLVFADGSVRQGYVTVNGKTYYYNAKGELMKNGLVGSKSEGYRYADKNGVVDMNYTGIAKNSKGYWYVYKGLLDFSIRNGVTWNGEEWNVLDGAAYKATSEKDLTFHRALKIAYKVTNSSMTKKQKLRAVWNHLTTAYGECSPRSFGNFSMGWHITYANDIFVRGTGDCFSYGAAFAYLAKAVGYTESYACNSGGHGWTEVDGLVYDPEWSMHSKKYSYYGMSYDEPCDVPYKSALRLGSSWSHVKV